MILLLDQGLPRTTVLALRESGLEAEHVGDVGLATADDRAILAGGAYVPTVAVGMYAPFRSSNGTHATICVPWALMAFLLIVADPTTARTSRQEAS